jgi:hypothetical protein
MARYFHFSKNRRSASIEATRILSWPPSHLSTVERDTPSSPYFARPAALAACTSAPVKRSAFLSATNKLIASFNSC